MRPQLERGLFTLEDDHYVMNKVGGRIIPILASAGTDVADKEAFYEAAATASNAYRRYISNIATGDSAEDLKLRMEFAHARFIEVVGEAKGQRALEAMERIIDKEVDACVGNTFQSR